jgi:hypothetical protein
MNLSNFDGTKQKSKGNDVEYGTIEISFKTKDFFATYVIQIIAWYDQLLCHLKPLIVPITN